MKRRKIQKIDEKWLSFALEDYDLVMYLSKGDKQFNRSICFHAQQYVEKILKGILELNEILPPRTHDINALCKRIANLDIKIPLSEKQILFLSSVYIDTRYPPDIGLLPEGDPSQSDVNIAVGAVNKIRAWIQ